jgi:hypothetical protein
MKAQKKIDFDPINVAFVFQIMRSMRLKEELAYRIVL